MTIVERTTPDASVAVEDREGWFARLARFSVRRRRLVMLAWLIGVLVAAPLALRLSDALSGHRAIDDGHRHRHDGQSLERPTPALPILFSAVQEPQRQGAGAAAPHPARATPAAWSDPDRLVQA